MVSQCQWGVEAPGFLSLHPSLCLSSGHLIFHQPVSTMSNKERRYNSRPGEVKPLSCCCWQCFGSKPVFWDLLALGPAFKQGACPNPFHGHHMSQLMFLSANAQANSRNSRHPYENMCVQFYHPSIDLMVTLITWQPFINLVSTPELSINIF